MDEVGDGVVDAERGCVQVPADLHVVSGHDADGRLVLVIEHLPLKRGTQQQHEVIWKRDTALHHYALVNSSQNTNMAEQ